MRDMLGKFGDIVLLYLLEQNDWTNMSDIRRDTDLGQAAVATGILNIKELNLIEERRGDRNAREFKLNEKGIEIGKDVKKLQDKLKN